MSAILLFFTFCLICTNVESSRDYIVYSTPGRSRRPAGLYGGYYEFGKKLDMELTHINRAHYKRTSLTGIAVDSLSYDPVSKNLLLIGSNSLDNFLAKIDPCKNERIEGEEFYIYPSYKIHAGPFALYDSSVYYIAREHRLVDKFSVRMSLSIRKVTGCENDENTFVDRRKHDRLECSVEVAKISDEEIAKAKKWPFSDSIATDIAENIRTVGSTLLVVKKGEKLYFFVQIANPIYTSGRSVDKYSLDLYEVEEGGQAKILQSTTVDKKWTGHIMSSIGDISYKDGLLCWSTFENIFCESWPRTGNTPSVTNVLKKGEARSVCTVSDYSSRYRDVITGIQIIKTNPLQIAFGCWASWFGQGGAGYLYSNSQGTFRNVTAMEDGEGKILAGAMVAIDGCSHQ